MQVPFSSAQNAKLSGNDEKCGRKDGQRLKKFGQILDSSKLKEFAYDNFKFDENGRKLSKWVENPVGKGEIARYEQFLLFPQCFQKYEQFLLFPQCFQKACFPEPSKGVIVWERVNFNSLKSKIAVV